jgi:hypothetical protein
MELALQFSNFYLVKNLVNLLNLVPNEPKKYSVNIPIVRKLECIVRIIYRIKFFLWFFEQTHLFVFYSSIKNKLIMVFLETAVILAKCNQRFLAITSNSYQLQQ